ncbi:hypothetical protein PLICRDRAFT_57297 [Plicaturopsis crispa FD-325 SS-3]|uniref:DDE Tnp4 domain-containing protein n=1 Tax=Plicaturopsis crispa FD-325 SS-3 TaxID=944288 RepID=A0A0C9SRL3_PLICR|nr:hypothetical protein PLICRDRAFT_57297 [Plicaturopsis crispa FD-325 SS-3]
MRAALAVVLLLGTEDVRLERAARRNPSRLYLRRPQLLPNPRILSAWQRLYESQDDRAFITTMGFDVDTFQLLLDSGFEEKWNATPIPRSDVAASGQPRLGARSLDASGALGLVLHWLNSAMLEHSLQLIFALIPTTVSRYLDFARRILLETVRAMPEGAVGFPKTLEEYEENSALIVERHPLLEGAFGSIDGLGLLAQEAVDPEMENATYNGWKSGHYFNNILAFSPQGIIIAAVLNSPGSWHDAHVARPVFETLRRFTPEGYYLVADTAFPRGTASIAGKIKAPLKGGQRITADPTEQQRIMRYQRQLLSYRQTAEWGMRMFQGSWGRLRVPLDVNDEGGRKELLELCVRSSNVRTRCVGINQIRNVYMPRWQESEDERLWTDLRNMMFKDIRRTERVSRYHLVIEEDP